MLCHFCGNNLPNPVKFCSECGSRVIRYDVVEDDFDIRHLLSPYHNDVVKDDFDSRHAFSPIHNNLDDFDVDDTGSSNTLPPDISSSIEELLIGSDEFHELDSAQSHLACIILRTQKRRTDGGTEGRTDGQRQNNIHPPMTGIIIM
ncbi:uncharacterized protein LOC127833495 isoform X1 [Dreissena polymorpha]|uniref:uncharacterized protein LOC127833495 isoform X1 n=1 Tax=Dreissena polymorpha TaxID=45954 RepID=UPI00226403B7|nr:uncharacterized protein LOC127833495 isoform X1 [Dreissena polymorpha]